MQIAGPSLNKNLKGGGGGGKKNNTPTQQTGQKTQQQGQASGKTDGQKAKGTGNRKWSSYKAKYVRPWPEGKPYMSHNGLSFAINRHFSGYCFKCGILGHQGGDCRIYKGTPTTLTLCGVCRRGFHHTCKNAFALSKPRADSPMPDKDLIKRLERLEDLEANTQRAQTGFYYPFPPPVQQQQPQLLPPPKAPAVQFNPPSTENFFVEFFAEFSVLNFI